MSLLSDLINLDLSDTTDKIIAEYIWYQSVPLPLFLQSLFSVFYPFPLTAYDIFSQSSVVPSLCVCFFAPLLGIAEIL